MAAAPADLTRLISPRAIAVIGASSGRERLSGRTVENLVKFGYPGLVIPVNRKRAMIDGLAAVARLDEAPDVDVAFVSVPSVDVEGVLKEVAERGIPFAVVLTSGYEGLEGQSARESLETLIPELRAQGLRVLGPNCIGIIDVSGHMMLRPAMFVRSFPRPGGITVISQSGGLSLAVLNEAATWGIGLRNVVHTGNEFDLGVADLIAYAAQDDGCDSIAITIEQIRDPEEFKAATVLAAAAGKRLSYLKVGRSVRGTQASATHTGAVAGDAVVYDAFLRDLGFIRADTPQDLIIAADCSWPRPGDEGMAAGVVTISGGEAGLAADIADHYGVELAAPPSFPRLGARLGEGLMNPVDVTGRVYGQETLIEDAILDLRSTESCGPIIVSFPPSSVEHLGRFSESMVTASHSVGGGIAVVVSGASEDAAASTAAFRDQGIAVFESLRDAFWKLSNFPASVKAPEQSQNGPTERDARNARHLSEFASMLRQLNLNVPAIMDLAGPAMQVRFPVAVKAEHPAIVHRAKSGLLVLGVESDVELERASLKVHSALEAAALGGGRVVAQEMARVLDPRELLVGYRHDALFGDLLIVGAGGVDAGADRRGGEGHAFVQVTSPSQSAARRAVDVALAAGWIALDADAPRGSVDSHVHGIWSMGSREQLAEWEVNPLIVGRDGACAIVDGVGFSA